MQIVRHDQSWWLGPGWSELRLFVRSEGAQIGRSTANYFSGRRPESASKSVKRAQALNLGSGYPAQQLSGGLRHEHVCGHLQLGPHEHRSARHSAGPDWARAISVQPRTTSRSAIIIADAR